MIMIVGEIRRQTLSGARHFQQGLAPRLGSRATLGLEELPQFGVRLFQFVARRALAAR
jgi:hypothetical protein